MHDQELVRRFETYAGSRIAGARNLHVTGLTRIHGGASRQTYSIDIEYETDSGPVRRGLIVRRDPPDSLIDTERRIEFAAIRSAFGHSDLPVPEALFLEEDPAALGAPFFVMERIGRGGALNPFNLQQVDDQREEIGRQFFRHLGAIAALPVESAPLAEEIEVPAPDHCWQRELDYWANEIRSNAASPQPVSEAAIRYLQTNPPPPAQRLSIVHGDYRSGNFLVDDAGEMTAILDWEMAHIGDPYEDLAWATDLFWCGNDQARAAGFLPWPDAIAIWQDASGCQFDPKAFEWWSLFAHVKALGIWVSSAKAFAGEHNSDPILAFSGWFTHAAHEVLLAMRLAPKFTVNS